MASARTRYFAKKLFELSGFLPVGGFLLEHLYTNFQHVGPGGDQRFNEAVVALQTNPLIIFLEIFAIGVPLLYHALYGIFVASQARPNNGSYGFLRNWLYLFQRISGIILLFYIGYHVWNTRLAPVFHPDDPLLQRSALGEPMVSSAYMHNYLNDVHFGIPVFWIYFVGIACAVYHFANGVWNIGYHWGITVSPKAQRWWGMACGLLGVTLLAIALATLRSFIITQA